MESLKLERFYSDNEYLGDTFRPSLLNRIDSQSSIQSYDFQINDIDLYEENISGLSKQPETKLDISSLYSEEHEKFLHLDYQVKSNNYYIENLQRNEKLLSEQLKSALSKNTATQDQFFLEIDYLKSKISFLEQKNKEISEKSEKTDKLNEELKSNLLSKEKKILWLENEIFAKEIKIKGLGECEIELCEMRKFKENYEILKEKIQICESQITSLKKEKKETASQFNIEVAVLNNEKDRLRKDLESSSKKYEKLITVLKENNDIIKGLQAEKENFGQTPKPELKEKTILSSLKGLLKVESEDGIFLKIEALLKIKSYEKLFRNISKLVTDCSPIGTFSSPPSTTQIWKYLRKVMETYMQLSKDNNKYLRILKQVESASCFEEMKSVLCQEVN